AAGLRPPGTGWKRRKPAGAPATEGAIPSRTGFPRRCTSPSLPPESGRFAAMTTSGGAYRFRKWRAAPAQVGRDFQGIRLRSLFCEDAGVSMGLRMRENSITVLAALSTLTFASPTPHIFF